MGNIVPSHTATILPHVDCFIVFYNFWCLKVTFQLTDRELNDSLLRAYPIHIIHIVPMLRWGQWDSEKVSDWPLIQLLSTTSLSLKLLRATGAPNPRLFYSLRQSSFLCATPPLVCLLWQVDALRNSGMMGDFPWRRLSAVWWHPDLGGVGRDKESGRREGEKEKRLGGKEEGGEGTLTCWFPPLQVDLMIYWYKI